MATATAKLFLRERDPSIGERESVPVLGFSGSNELTESSRDRIDAIYTTVNYIHWQTLFFLPIHMYETVNS
jgi:hypothetical protein